MHSIWNAFFDMINERFIVKAKLRFLLLGFDDDNIKDFSFDNLDAYLIDKLFKVNNFDDGGYLINAYHWIKLNKTKLLTLIFSKHWNKFPTRNCPYKKACFNQHYKKNVAIVSNIFDNELRFFDIDENKINDVSISEKFKVNTNKDFTLLRISSSPQLTYGLFSYKYIRQIEINDLPPDFNLAVAKIYKYRLKGENDIYLAYIELIYDKIAKLNYVDSLTKVVREALRESLKLKAVRDLIYLDKIDKIKFKKK